MARYDVVVIGAGLGGLTAGAILAREGRKVLVIERGNSVGGAASSYKAGDLFIEASLHKTSGPEDVRDPKHRALTRAGVLDKVEWVPTGSIFQVRGGPLPEPFMLPPGFDAAREALTQRFPEARDGIVSILSEMESIANAAGSLSHEGKFRNPLESLDGLKAALPNVRDWSLSLAQKFEAAFGRNEAVKCALAGNLWHYHDDPASLWWIFFAASQGGYLQSGGRYVKTGSQRLSSALARTILRSEGCAIALRRVVTDIGIDAHGRANSVTHIAKAGGDPQSVEADCVVTNAAPATAASLLPQLQGSKLSGSYADRASSVSLFALTLGLSRKPDEIGLANYSTQLLPDWMRSLADYAKGTALFANEPAERMPPMSIVNYAAIDSGVPNPPYIVSVVGTDRLSNWSGVERPVYTAKRARWQDAIVGHLDRIYPGLKEAIVASALNTASSMVSYLNVPDGAAYGFAPSPPVGSRIQPRSPHTVIDGLYLASSYAGFGGYNGAIQAGQACADEIIGAKN